MDCDSPRRSLDRVRYLKGVEPIGALVEHSFSTKKHLRATIYNDSYHEWTVFDFL